MSSFTYFTVVGDFLSVAEDSTTDADYDPDTVAIKGTVTFTPLVNSGDVLLATTLDPRPASVLPVAIRATIDVDGQLKHGEEIGVRLLANCGVLGLSGPLYYSVVFSGLKVNNTPVSVRGFTFEAPTTDTQINLVDILPVPHPTGASGITKGDKGDRGWAFAGLTPAGDGTYAQGLVDSPDGPVPTGDPFAVTLAYNSTVTHGTNSATARPPLSVAVIWIGSVEPFNAIDGDVWMDTSGTAPGIQTTTLDSLNVAAPISQLLLASGSSPLLWSVVSGELPDGMLLSSGGDFYGSPTTAGDYSFGVQCLNAFGEDTSTYSGSVGSEIAPTIITTALTTILDGIAFSQTLSVSGSVPITFAIQSGSLPAGLSLDTSAGVVSGTPSGATGEFSVTVRATNATGFDDQTFTGTVTGAAPTITTTSLASMWRGFAFSQTVAATGSIPITFAIQTGSLPAGLSLDTSTGAITGTPATTGSYSSFTVRATSSYGFDDQVFTGSVLESTPSIAETSLNTATKGVAFAQTLTLSTGGPTITWSIQSGSLPTGLSLASTGAITGTPTTASENYSTTIRASNGTTYDDQVFAGTVTSGLPQLIGAGTKSTSASYSETIPAGATHAIFLTAQTSTASTRPNYSISIGAATATLLGTPLSCGKPSASSFYFWMALYVVDLQTNSISGTQTITQSTAATLYLSRAIYWSNLIDTGTLTTQALVDNTTSTITKSMTVASTNANYVYMSFFLGRGAVNAFTSVTQTQIFDELVSSMGSATASAYHQGNGGNLTFSATIPGGLNTGGMMVLPLIGTM